ncbi:MAG TPA: hypothetical protein VF529_19410 [Solirubrobacteraceae bacterium]|jgi:hypothetical protein
MADFEKLELSTETLRQLTEEELRTVAGGDVQWTPGCPLTLKIREILDATSATC